MSESDAISGEYRSARERLDAIRSSEPGDRKNQLEAGLHGSTIARTKAFEKEFEAREAAAEAEARATLLQKQLEKAEAEAERLRYITQSSRYVLKEPSDSRELLTSITQRIAEVVGDACFLSLASDDGQRLHPVAAKHRDPRSQEKVAHFLLAAPQELSRTLGGDVYLSGEPLLIAPQDALKQQTSFCRNRVGASYMLLVPLKVAGRTLGILGLVRDSGGEPYTPDDLILVQELAHHTALVAENRELQRRMVEAKWAAAGRDAFLADLNHELRGTMHAVIGYAEMIQEDPADTEMVSADAARISRAARDVATLLNNLVLLADIASGRVRTAIDQVRLSEVLSNSSAAAAEALSRSGLRLRLPELEGDDTVQTDFTHLQGIVVNLLLMYSQLFSDADLVVEVHSQAEGSHAGTVLELTCSGVAREAEPDEAEDAAAGLSKSCWRGSETFVEVARQLSGLLGGRIDFDQQRDQCRVSVLIPQPDPLGQVAAPFCLLPTEKKHASTPGNGLQKQLAQTSAPSAAEQVRVLQEELSAAQRRLHELAEEIAERKRLGDTLVKKQRGLDERLNTRTTQLKESTRELELVGRFTSTVLASSLRSVESSLCKVRRSGTRGASQNVLAILGTVASQVALLHEQVEDIGRFTEAARHPIQKQELDTRKQVQEVWSELQAPRSLQLIADELPSVNADPSVFQTVIRTLLKNALEFTRETADARIEVACLGGEPCVWMVRDNGAGLPAGKQHRLFLPFQRLHTRDFHSGTGLSLATARKLLERHGGKIWVESEEGKGAAFFFTLGS